MAKKFFVVWKGHKPGIYQSWDEAKTQVDSYPGAKHVSVKSEAMAKAAYAASYEDYLARRVISPELPPEALEGYVSDGACSGNHGPVEWRCVKISSGEELFRKGPHKGGTNNVAEFLGLVDSIIFLTERAINAPLYCDSEDAIKWVKAKKAHTDMPHTTENAPLFDLITRAETWLRENNYSVKVLKWDTDAWDENPADFRRK